MKFALGFITAIIIGALALGVVWGLDRFGIVNSKNLILQAVSYYPGLKDLSAGYELGQKQSAVLEQRVNELQNMAGKIKMEQAKLNKERADFDESKLNWEKQHLLPANTTPGAPAATPTAAAKGALLAVNQPQSAAVPKGLKPSAPLVDPKLKAYLATIGSMKPAMAAQVLQKLPENITFLVLEQTPDRQITKIMEFMPPEYVAALTRDRVGNSVKK